MKQEFIVVNKTQLQKKIAELIKEGDVQRELCASDLVNISIQQEKATIRNIIALSTPLDSVMESHAELLLAAKAAFEFLKENGTMASALYVAILNAEKLNK